MVEQLGFIAVFTAVELGPVSPIKLRQFQPASHRWEDRLGNGFSHTIKNGNIDGTLANSSLKGTNPLARSLSRTTFRGNPFTRFHFTKRK